MNEIMKTFIWFLHSFAVSISSGESVSSAKQMKEITTQKQIIDTIENGNANGIYLLQNMQLTHIM